MAIKLTCFMHSGDMANLLPIIYMQQGKKIIKHIDKMRV